MSAPVQVDVDVRPIAFDIEGAMAYTGLSRWRLNQLARDEEIVVRQEGRKNLFIRESLDRYVLSLPARGSR